MTNETLVQAAEKLEAALKLACENNTLPEALSRGDIHLIFLALLRLRNKRTNFQRTIYQHMDGETPQINKGIVYLIWCKCGQLLYVGSTHEDVSADFTVRLDQHAATKLWWQWAEFTVLIECRPDAATDLEAKLVKSLSPQWNTHHNPRAKSRSDLMDILHQCKVPRDTDLTIEQVVEKSRTAVEKADPSSCYKLL